MIYSAYTHHKIYVYTWLSMSQCILYSMKETFEIVLISETNQDISIIYAYLAE